MSVHSLGILNNNQYLLNDTENLLCIRFRARLVASYVQAAYPSGAPEFSPVFYGVRVTRSLVVYVNLVDHYLSFCSLYAGHSVVRLRYSDSCYPFGIFKLFLQSTIGLWGFSTVFMFIYHYAIQFK